MTTVDEGTRLSADEALGRLIEGNQRFLRGEARSSAFRRETLTDLAKAQRPYATVLGCSDSRVPPEWIFDTGLGELFVIRVAGNVFSPEIAGTLQYAGSYLETPLFVILGHEGCGAITAALATKHEGDAVSFPGSAASGEHPPGPSGFRSDAFSRRTGVARRREQRAVDGSPDPGFAGRESAHGGGANEDRRRGLRDRNGSREVPATSGVGAAYASAKVHSWTSGVLHARGCSVHSRRCLLHLPFFWSLAMRVHGFAPVVNSGSRVLVLGSMPGKASLRAGEYYAHPRNLFWHFMERLLAVRNAEPYEQRLEQLLSHRVALWDVLKTCTRGSSLDSDIVLSSAVANDFASLFETHPAIRVVCFNGARAAASFRRNVLPSIPRSGRFVFHDLPSTSPANASIPLETKLAAWRVVACPPTQSG